MKKADPTIQGCYVLRCKYSDGTTGGMLAWRGSLLFDNLAPFVNQRTSEVIIRFDSLLIPLSQIDYYLKTWRHDEGDNGLNLEIELTERSKIAFAKI